LGMDIKRILKYSRISFGFVYFLFNAMIFAVFVIMAVYTAITSHHNPGWVMKIFPLIGMISGHWIRRGIFSWWRILIIIISFLITSAALVIHFYLGPLMKKADQPHVQQHVSSPQALILIQAVEKKDLALVKDAIASGADLNAKNKMGRSALHLALLDGAHDIARFLIEKGADVDSRDNLGETPIFVTENIEMLKLLIAQGADVNAREYEMNMTPIYFKGGELLRILVEAGADVRARSEKGNTPLMFHAYSNNIEGIKYFVSKGADPHAVNEDGQTALDIAETFYHPELVKYLKSL